MIRKPTFFLDGSNIAYSGKQHPSLQRVFAVRDRLLADYPGAECVVLMDAPTRHRLADEEKKDYERLVRAGVIEQTPASESADCFLLSFARQAGGMVVSGDRFERTEEEREQRVGVAILRPMVSGRLVVIPAHVHLHDSPRSGAARTIAVADWLRGATASPEPRREGRAMPGDVADLEVQVAAVLSGAGGAANLGRLMELLRSAIPDFEARLQRLVGGPRVGRSLRFLRARPGRFRVIAAGRAIHVEVLPTREAAGPAAAPASAVIPDLDPLDQARRLLTVAARALGSGDGWILKSRLRNEMVRRDPGFDPRAFGDSSFTAFLVRCSDLVEVVSGFSDHVVRLRGFEAEANVEERSAGSRGGG